MLCASSDSVRLGGSLGQALTRGVQIGGKFVEVYEPDVNNPAQQTVLATTLASDLSRDILWQDNSTGQRAIWLMNGTHYSSGASLGTVDPSWNIVGTGDFNGDGKTDILWQNNFTGQRVIWFMNGMRYSSGFSFATVDPSWNIAGSGDFNGDGKSDIVWQNSATGARVIWLMNGTSPIGTVNLGTVDPSWNIRNY